MGAEHSRIRKKYQQTPRTQSDRAPDSYSNNQLQQTAASAPIYPNLNQGPSNPNNGQYVYHDDSPFWLQPQHQDFAIVNADGHSGRPKPLMSEAQVKRLLDAQKQEYEKKLEEVAARAEAQRKQDEAAKAVAQRKQQEEAAKAAAQRKQQEEVAKAAAQRKQQEEAAKAAAQRRQQEEAAKAAAQQKQQEEAAKAAAQRKQQEEATRTAAQRKQQEEAGKAAALNSTYSYNRPAPGRAPPGLAPPRGPAPRPRSISSNSPRERDVLDCPICHTRYGMRIFQCDSGHSSCNDCKNRGRACGICKKSLTNRRNFDLENHIAQTKAPCPHSSEGCKLFIKIADMENHVRECPFKEQDCPVGAVFGTCRWKGKLSQISSHFDSMHIKGCQINVGDAIEVQLVNVRSQFRRVQLIVRGVYNFLLHVNVSKTEGKVYVAVQLIGTKFSAMKWLYELHVYNKSENHRKYMYTDNCCSSIDIIEDVFKEENCAVLPLCYVGTFVCNGALNYKIFIKKVNEENKGSDVNKRRRVRKN